MESEERHINLGPNDPKHVYLNQGLLKVVLVVDSREKNRELLDSLFTHLGEWFTENVEHLADAPEVEGSTWRLHEDLFVVSQETPSADLPDITDIPDTLPEGWSL